MRTTGQALIHQRTQRYQQFYQSARPGDIRIVVRQRPYWIEKQPLYTYDFEQGGHLQMAEDMARSADVMLARSAQIDDDLIPWLAPDLGIAIHHTCIIDGPVAFAEWTSWAPHPLQGDDGYQRLEEVVYDPANPWVRRMREMVQYWKTRDEQPYLINTHHHFSPLDLANALRGNELFTDFYDVPDLVHELLRRCTEAIIALETDLRQEVGPQPGLPFWGALAPAGNVFISEDTMDMIGPALAKQWGRPWSERVRDALGGLAVHHHMLGSAVQGVIGNIPQHSLVQISNDPNCPEAAEQLYDLSRMSGTNALMFDCTVEQLQHLAPVLAQIHAIAVVAVGDDPVAARAAVNQARAIAQAAHTSSADPAGCRS